MGSSLLSVYAVAQPYWPTTKLTQRVMFVNMMQRVMFVNFFQKKIALNFAGTDLVLPIISISYTVASVIICFIRFF